MSTRVAGLRKTLQSSSKSVLPVVLGVGAFGVTLGVLVTVGRHRKRSKAIDSAVKAGHIPEPLSHKLLLAAVKAGVGAAVPILLRQLVDKAKEHPAAAK
ncbi:MAG TPA: hypothetical protein VFW71_14770 [Actinomycetota bacterium]|nr:hypothetical protein [Actinomycetota bacterium]